MRISDWSSDVCSSDLCAQRRLHPDLYLSRRAADCGAALSRHRRGAWPVVGGAQGLCRALCRNAATMAGAVRCGGRRSAPADRLRRAFPPAVAILTDVLRSEEHSSELQYIIRNSYAVFRLNNKKAN